MTTYVRSPTSGTSRLLAGLVFDGNTDLFSDQGVRQKFGENAASVSADFGGIAYLPGAFISDAKPVEIISQCGIASAPGAFSVKNGEYPLVRELYLYNRADNVSTLEAEFLDFTTSASADGIIEKAGFVSDDVVSTSLEPRLGTLRDSIKTTTNRNELALKQEMFIEMTDWERLSTILRFRVGSNRLDNPSQRLVARLVQYLAEQQPAGIAFVGFTDSDGQFAANYNLSIQRAEAVKNLILEAAQRSGNANLSKPPFPYLDLVS